MPKHHCVAQQLGRDLASECLKYHQMEFQYCFSTEDEMFLQIVFLLKFALLHYASHREIDSTK